MCAYELGIDGISDVEPVATGGNSVIYRANQRSMDRLVAVKVLNLADGAARRRFDRERKAMGRLSRHPGVVTLYETGFTSDGKPFLIMPWIDGGSLQDRLDESGPMPWGEATRIVAEVAETLQSAHDSGVVHADIKPANLLLTSGDRVLIADFGIARLSDFAATQTRSVALTPHYAAPELVSGQPPTIATDIYGLGATLYALIEGHPPYETDGDLVALADAVTSTETPSLSLDVPLGIREGCERSMSASPKDRFATAADFARILLNSPVDTSPNLRPANRSANRGWVLAAVSIALLVVLGAGFVVNRVGTADVSDAAPPTLSTVTTERATTTTVDVPAVVTSIPATSTTAVSTTVPPPPTVVDVFENAAVREIPLVGALRSPVFDSGVVWVTRDEDDGRGTLIRINAMTAAVIETIAVGSAPRGPVFVDGYPWVYTAGDGRLTGVGTDGDDFGASIAVTKERVVGDAPLGRSHDEPIVATDGRIWIAANPEDDLFVSVSATAPDTGEVERFEVDLLSASSLLASETAIWIPGASVCFDASQSWTTGNVTSEAERLEAFGVPVHTVCETVVRIDLATGTVASPALVGPDPDQEWVDPDSRVPTVLCTVGLSDCISGTRPASDLYVSVSKWWEPGLPPAVFGRGLLWVRGNAGVFSIDETGERQGVYLCGDSFGSAPLAIGDVLWMWEESGGLCAVDVTEPVNVRYRCGRGLDCWFIGESALPVYWPDAGPLDIEILPAVIPSGYGTSAWVAGTDGLLMLVDRTAAESGASVEILFSYDVGPGLAAPLVTPDGSVWAASQGRLTRITPKITPSQFALLATDD